MLKKRIEMKFRSLLIQVLKEITYYLKTKNFLNGAMGKKKLIVFWQF